MEPHAMPRLIRIFLRQRGGEGANCLACRAQSSGLDLGERREEGEG